MINKETYAAGLENRIAILESRKKDNGNIG